VVHVCTLHTGEVFVLWQRGRGTGKRDDVSSAWRGSSNPFGWWVRVFQMDRTQCTELVWMMANSSFPMNPPSRRYRRLNKPVWVLPEFLIAPLWTATYSCMGFGSFLLIRTTKHSDELIIPLSCYAGQLMLSFLWTPIFYRVQSDHHLFPINVWSF